MSNDNSTEPGIVSAQLGHELDAITAREGEAAVRAFLYDYAEQALSGIDVARVATAGRMTAWRQREEEQRRREVAILARLEATGKTTDAPLGQEAAPTGLPPVSEGIKRMEEAYEATETLFAKAYERVVKIIRPAWSGRQGCNPEAVALPHGLLLALESWTYRLQAESIQFLPVSKMLPEAEAWSKVLEDFQARLRHRFPTLVSLV